MKALVYYCRWQEASLRLRGREETAVFGELVFTEDDGSERAQKFHFNLQTSQLTLYDANGAEQTIHLDEMGIPTDD